jgi:hypothetical protein
MAAKPRQMTKISPLAGKPAPRALGTSVNGEPIGSHFHTDIAELKPGQSEIIAGGFGSDFAFKTVVR